ncbi:MAG: hypothetical protein ACRYG4_25010 [Janthinobacterium lividum]
MTNTRDVIFHVRTYCDQSRLALSPLNAVREAHLKIAERHRRALERIFADESIAVEAGS